MADTSKLKRQLDGLSDRVERNERKTYTILGWFRAMFRAKSVRSPPTPALEVKARIAANDHGSVQLSDREASSFRRQLAAHGVDAPAPKPPTQRGDESSQRGAVEKGT